MPLKEAALELGEVDELAGMAGAANTLIFDDDGVRRLYNTDVGGLVNAADRRRGGGRRAGHDPRLRGDGPFHAGLPARLGAAEVTVVARTPAKAAPLVPLAETLGVGVRLQDWSEPIGRHADLLVSTVNAGAADDRAERLAGARCRCLRRHLPPVADPAGLGGGRRPGAVLNGLDLLVDQALLQIELMTGSAVPAAVLYQAGRAALAAPC